ncbi:unnamed protein product [Larinioides sclopetarius]|uniref:Uncharacterized protein n=1 Tax=Larinioides sclopetarius TaxID=280406 RepID=A0AAV1Z3U8_9ARAC
MDDKLIINVGGFTTSHVELTPQILDHHVVSSRQTWRARILLGK